MVVTWNVTTRTRDGLQANWVFHGTVSVVNSAVAERLRDPGN